MAKKVQRYTRDIRFWLQVLTGIFFMTQGLQEILGYTSDVAQFGRQLKQVFGGNSDVMGLIVAILEMAAGAVLIIVLFATVRAPMYRFFVIAVLVVWLVGILNGYFFNNFAEPDVLSWFNGVALHGIIAVLLWSFAREK
jgi:hypothetical protein